MTRRILIVTLILQLMAFARAPLAGAQDCPPATGTDTFRGELVELEELEELDVDQGEEAEQEEAEEEEAEEDDSDSDSEDEDVAKPPKRYRAVVVEATEDADEDTAEDVTDDATDEDTAEDVTEDAEDEAAENEAPVEVRREFLLLGKGDKLEIGSSYLVTLTEFDRAVVFTDRVAYLGDDIECTEGSTIVAINDDGGTSEIDISGFDLPSLPIDPRQVVLAFGALAVVTFLFREPRVNQ